MKGFLTSKIFIVVLCVIAVVSGILYFSKPKQEAQIDNNTGVQKQDSEWITYTNNKFKYTINYHKSWHKQKDGEPPYPPPPAGMTFSKNWDNSNEMCGFEILSSNVSGDNKGEIESLTQDTAYTKSEGEISGEKTVKFFLTNDVQEVESNYIDYDTKAYRIGYNISKGSYFNECKNVVEKMLSSFKFL